MKLLLDENIPVSIKKTLLANGYNVEHANQNLKGKKDREVFEYAVKNKQCIITYDIDFKEMKKEPHYGIIKIDQITDNYQQKLLKILEECKQEGLQDVYIYLGRTKLYKEVKKYTKKKHKFKQFHRISLENI